jgi:hypothetical protein
VRAAIDPGEGTAVAASAKSAHGESTPTATGYSNLITILLAFVYRMAIFNRLGTTNDEKHYSNGKTKGDTAATYRTPTDAEKAWSEKIADPS